jgi:hypothetical protein
MRVYDVYRCRELKACIRVWNTGEIDWAYYPQAAEWNGLWRSNDIKAAIEHVIREYPTLNEFPMTDFVVRLRDTQVIPL